MTRMHKSEAEDPVQRAFWRLQGQLIISTAAAAPLPRKMVGAIRQLAPLRAARTQTGSAGVLAGLPEAYEPPAPA